MKGQTEKKESNIDDFLRLQSRVNFDQYGYIQFILLPISIFYEMVRPLLMLFMGPSASDKNLGKATGASILDEEYTPQNDTQSDANTLDNLIKALKGSTCIYKQPIIEILEKELNNGNDIMITAAGTRAHLQNKLAINGGQLGDFGIFDFQKIMPYVYSVDPHAKETIETFIADTKANVSDMWDPNIDRKTLISTINKMNEKSILIALLDVNSNDFGKRKITEEGKKYAIEHVTDILLRKPDLLPPETQLPLHEFLYGLALLYSTPQQNEKLKDDSSDTITRTNSTDSMSSMGSNTTSEDTSEEGDRVMSSNDELCVTIAPDPESSNTLAPDNNSSQTEQSSDKETAPHIDAEAFIKRRAALKSTAARDKGTGGTQSPDRGLKGSLEKALEKIYSGTHGKDDDSDDDNNKWDDADNSTKLKSS